MTSRINELSEVTSLSNGDLIVIYAIVDGEPRKAAVSTLLDRIAMNTDAETISGKGLSYLLDLANATGTLTVGRLSGEYNIDISGNAATATNADNATVADSATTAINADSANTAGVATKATNIEGGSIGELLYQGSADTTSKLAVGTSGQFLKCNGASAPTWADLDFTATKAATGEQKLPSGLIMKWGLTGSIGINGTSAVSFATAFPAAIVNVQVTKIVSGPINDSVNIQGSPSTTGFTIVNGGTATSGVYWYAIGY